jgi:GTP-binding protein
MHLSVLVETMRREGYELQLGQPTVIIKEIDGKKCEPVELLTIDCPEDCSGKIIEIVSQRKGEMISMEPKGDLTHIEFKIPSRGIIGLRTHVLNLSAGEAIMAHTFEQFEPWKGEVPTRNNGTLIAMETGKTIPFSLNNLQDRGKFYVPPGVDIYAGQVIGEHIRHEDLVVNVTKKKAMSNMRSSGADEKVKLAPPIIFSLEQCMEYIQADEYVECTPESLRIRKILLNETDRKRASRGAVVNG